jgi:hypothetical protein
LNILDSYSKEVFHTDITKHARPLESNCSCNIL